MIMYHLEKNPTWGDDPISLVIVEWVLMEDHPRTCK